MLKDTEKTYMRGDIVYIDFGTGKGSVQSGVRPAIIISNDKGNYYSSVLIVAPITSKIKKPMPTHLKLDKGLETGLKYDSFALFEQPMTISKEQVLSMTGHHNISKFEEVKMLIALGCLTFLGEGFKSLVCL